MSPERWDLLLSHTIQDRSTGTKYWKDASWAKKKQAGATNLDLTLLYFPDRLLSLACMSRINGSLGLTRTKQSV